MHTRTTAGQASIEYVAAIALVAAIFVVAGPAVGGPDLGRLVVGKVRLALCVVAGDVCSDAQAKEAGLAPCPLATDLTGHEASVTIFSVELGGGTTLTVTPRSDGTVGVVRAASGSAGLGAGVGGSAGFGPVQFHMGADGTVRERVTLARGWEFPDRASADRFLARALRNTFNEREFPPAWHSLEGGPELQAAVGAAVGHSDARTSAGLIGAAGSAGTVLGGRVARDGAVTLYSRVAVEGELTWPLLPTLGTGRRDWIAEYTFDRAGPRELALRTGVPSKLGSELTETVARLDLRDPANLAAARSVLDAALPWPPEAFGPARALGQRIRTHGTIEITRSAVDDASWGVSAHAADEVKFGAGYRRINVHRSLVSALAYTGGPWPRERFDCEQAQR